MRSVGHVEHMEVMRDAYKFFRSVRNLLEHLSVDRNALFERIFKT
jgi:hypothetical protein